MSWLRDRLPKDAIICNGAGNYAGWMHRFIASAASHAARADFRLDGLWRAGGGAAKRQHPERIVVAFAGDGCFLMNGQEFATAVQYELPIIVIVVDNGITAPSACIRSAIIPAASSAPS